MELKQIEYFITVVDSGNFSLAGERCHISQSAISQQIKALESELGVELLSRHNRTFSLTKAGELLYRKGSILLFDVEQLKKQLQKHDVLKESLKIGYLNCYGGTQFQDAAATFSEIFPDVDLQIIDGNHEDLYNALIREDVDLVLNDQRRAFSDDYINFELVKSHCYIEISKNHPFAKLKQINVAELKTIPCILVAGREQQTNEMNYYRDIVGFSSEFLFAKNLMEARIMVAAGKGFLPIEGIRNDVYYDSSIALIPLCKKDVPVLRNYCAFWKKENANPYIEEFADILKDKFLFEDQVNN
ncbi:MAG: LysR family transcriptional regulator [Erysipelotrichaceae bacterium]|nr:LysR family transcriptional regulator [Erysipelotrichaceae bacterium]